MDGSEVTVIVLGQRGVGSTTFIAHTLGVTPEEVNPIQQAVLNVCGRDISVKIVDNPNRSQLIRATLVVILFDLTNKETFDRLHSVLEQAQRVSPTAIRAVVGTKADLGAQREVTTQEALAFCQSIHNGSSPLPYYETALQPSECIFIAFQEILSRPLINEYVLRATTEQELITFVHEAMEWAIQNNSANILTHLRDLGYAVPSNLVDHYPETMREYLFSEYPLRVVPRFSTVQPSEPLVEFDDFSLEECDEPLTVIDTRLTLQVTKMYHLMWKDISLTSFNRAFLDPNSIPVYNITHIDLSYNNLVSIPVQFFQIPNLESLNISHNQVTHLPGIEFWKLDTRLQILNASHNHIAGDNHSPVLYGRHRGNVRSPFPEFWYLDLSHNQFHTFPQWVLQFRSLKYLNIKHNPGIHKLPRELCQMRHLLSFQFDSLVLTDPPPLTAKWGSHSLLHYFSLKQKDAVPWSSFRVVVVGPKSGGKTTLLTKLRGEGAVLIAPTKGLEVVEWKYRGADLFSFRNKKLTFDLWDFSGDPDYHCIYACFNCANSLHLVVWDARQDRKELVRWLSDIQSTSVQRIPVIVVFTHMDTFKLREQKEEFKRRVIQWLDYHNSRFDSTNGAFSLMSSMSQTVRTLHGEEVLSSYEPPPEAFNVQDVCGDTIPLMPLVIKAHFVSNMTGDGLPKLRKTLYKAATGSLTQGIVNFPGFQMIGQEVPAVYANVESLIRQSRSTFRASLKEGEQKAFYSIPELMDKLQRPLKELNIEEKDFTAALVLMHELGFICLYKSQIGSTTLTMVGIDPQLVGYLLQRMIRAGLVKQEVARHNCALPNSHIFMLWGLEPIWSIDQDTNVVSSHHFINYLYHLNICAPLLPGVTLIPSTLPPTLPEGCNPDSSCLTPRRVYITGYLPSLFYLHLTSRIISALVTSHGPFPPISPNHAPPPVSTPLTTKDGTKLYLWQRNIFLEDADSSKLWLRVSEGKQVGPELLPYCGRIEVLVQAELKKEAAWLHLVTQEIDYLLEHVYPALLDAEQTPQQVEIFVPLVEEWAAAGASNGSCLPSERETRTEPLEIGTTIQPTVLQSPTITLPHSDPERLQTPSPEPQTQLQSNGNLSQSLKPVADFLSPQNTLHHSLSEQQSEASSWEVIHQSPSTSTRISLIQDFSSNYFLVPMWECLQEAFKTPVIRLHGNKLMLRDVIPDLLFADLPPESIFRNTVSSSEHYLVSLEEDFAGEGTPSGDVSGLFVRKYYTSEDADICARKPAGALKTFYLKQCLAHAREDLMRLRQLQCPHLVTAISVSFCPPSLALESAPLGSLQNVLKRKQETIGQDIIHQIALQLLSALECFHGNGLNYHSLNSDTVLLWTLDPVSIKLSDSGITHTRHSCELCSYLDSIPDTSKQWAVACRIDFVLLGLLMYEIGTGRRPCESVYTLGMVVQALLNNKLQLSIEAELQSQNEQRREKGEEEVKVCGCQRICLESTMNLCIYSDPVPVCELGARFSLCAGHHQWSPIRLLVNVECMLCSEHADLVYWASGSRGLVTGTLEPSTGKLVSNILQEAPPPESGLFAHRRGKPVPIAVGRATVLALVLATRQLWVGTENGLMGSAYVFNLPDMRRHHYIHLQDAVLSLCAVNDLGIKFGKEDTKYRVLVGLANGTIILFLGVHGGKVLENPLQGPKLVVVTHGRKPCLSINLTSDGHIWCGCGDTVEVFGITTLKSIRRLMTTQSLPPGATTGAETEEERKATSRGNVITLMVVSPHGVWIVTRRSPVLRLWNQVSGQLKASYSICNVLHDNQVDITALAIQGGAVWLGTRSGYVFVLDAAMMEAGEDPLLGLQYCGEGRVKCIVPLTPWKGVTPQLQVVCSLEYSDEVSSALLTWEYYSRQQWQHRSSTRQLFNVHSTPTPSVPSPSLLTPPQPLPSSPHPSSSFPTLSFPVPPHCSSSLPSPPHPSLSHSSSPHPTSLSSSPHPTSPLSSPHPTSPFSSPPHPTSPLSSPPHPTSPLSSPPHPTSPFSSPPLPSSSHPTSSLSSPPNPTLTHSSPHPTSPLSSPPLLSSLHRSPSLSSPSLPTPSLPIRTSNHSDCVIQCKSI